MSDSIVTGRDYYRWAVFTRVNNVVRELPEIKALLTHDRASDIGLDLRPAFITRYSEAADRDGDSEDVYTEREKIRLLPAELRLKIVTDDDMKVVRSLGSSLKDGNFHVTVPAQGKMPALELTLGVDFERSRSEKASYRA